MVMTYVMQYAYIFRRCQYTYANIHVVHIHTHPIAWRLICTLVCIWTHIRSRVYIRCMYMHVYLPMYTKARTYTHLSTPTHD